VSNEFEFVGGAVKPSITSNEKFLLWFIVGGNEIPLYQMQKMNLATIDYEGPMAYDGFSSTPIGREGFLVGKKYRTEAQFIKIFVYRANIGEPTRYYSFYAQFMDEPAPMVTVKPFSVDHTGLYFKGRIRFLRTKEVLSLLSDTCKSRKFVKTQGILSTLLLKQMIKVDRSEMRKGVRAIRILD